MKLKREDIEAFIAFCIKPYKRWIGLKVVARFKSVNDEKIPNPEWRPFSVRISKKDRQTGMEPHKEQYQCSQQTLKVLFGVLGSFYHFLLQEDITLANPVALIRQKSKFIRKESTQPVIRRLSDKQWHVVMNLTKEAAKKEIKQERSVFILSCLYSMYLQAVTHQST